MVKDRTCQVLWALDAFLGLTLPLGTALVVRVSLASLGRPVMPWSWIANHLPLFLILTLVLTGPFILLAIWSCWLLQGATRESYWRRMSGIVCATVTLSLTTVWLHCQWWQDVSDPMAFALMPIFVYIQSLATPRSRRSRGFCWEA